MTYQFNIYGDFANAQPGNDHADGGNEHDSGIQLLSLTHNVVILTANQKSCWWMMCSTTNLKVQVKVSVLYKSSEMVNAPGEPLLASRVPTTVVPAHK